MPNHRKKHAELFLKEGIEAPDETTTEYMRLIVDEGTLGASRHVTLIQELFLHLADSEDEIEPLRKKLSITGNFISETRGIDTPYIANSIRWTLRDLDQMPPEELSATIRDRSRQWATATEKRKRRILQIGANLLKSCKTLVLFDYSSTVAALVRHLFECGYEPTIVVFESRAISGGEPYIHELSDLNCRLHFLPDAAIEYSMTFSDAVLFGVETLRCDGSFLNTVGSKPLARIALTYGVPVYGCTDLYKLDLSSYNGLLKSPAIRTFDGLLPEIASDNKRAATMITDCPELEVVPSEMITAIITEHGPIPPQAMWTLGQKIFPETETKDEYG